MKKQARLELEILEARDTPSSIILDPGGNNPLPRPLVLPSQAGSFLVEMPAGVMGSPGAHAPGQIAGAIGAHDETPGVDPRAIPGVIIPLVGPPGSEFLESGRPDWRMIPGVIDP